MNPSVIAQTALAAGQDILFAIVTGMLACAMLGKRSGMFAPAALRAWRVACATALALTALAYLWLQAAVMSGSPPGDAGPAVVVAVLTQSHFGLAWSVGFAGALCAMLGSLPKERGLPLCAAGLVIWAAGKAAASHAADSGDFSWREAIHVAHLLATALWAGSVIVAARLLRKHSCMNPPGECVGHVRQAARVAFCSALSRLATVALVIVLVTGFCNVGQDTAQASAYLPDTTWGRLLTAKLVCVALAAVLGGWNRMTVLPDLRAHAGQNDANHCAMQRRFDRALLAEATVMLATLALAALLGHTSPTISGQYG